MRLLFVGDLAPTGFGTVTQDTGLELLDLGHDVRFLSQNELPELEEPFLSRTFVVNDKRDGWIDAAEFTQHGLVAGLIDGTFWADHWTPQAVLAIGDVYAMRSFAFSHEADEAALRSIPSFHYVPVEGVDLPPAWRKLWTVMSPIAMTEFGADEVAKVTGTRPPVVYHGVDQTAFYPVTAERPIRLGDAVLRTKEACRKYFGIPENVQLVIRTDANAWRKNYASWYRSLVPLLMERPNLWAVHHCRSADVGGDLRDLRSKYRPDIAERIKSTGVHDRFGMGWDRKTLCAFYNAADVYASVSAEGFGLTLAEAIACGIPAVGIDYSAVPEVIGPAGMTVPVGGLIDNPYGHYWAMVDEAKFREAVAHLLDTPNERAVLGAKGPGHVARNFSWKHAAAQFAAIIEDSLTKAAA